MPGLGDIRGHVRRGLRLKPSTSSGRIKHPTGREMSDLVCEVGSIDERNFEERKAEMHRVDRDGVDKRVLEEREVDKLEAINDWKYQNTELYNSFDSSVTLIVGANKVPFVAHKRMLRKNSPLFFAACKCEWLQKDNSVQLPEDEPATVQTMLYWVYHNRLGVPEKLFRKETAVEVDATTACAPGLLAKVYVLAEKYQMQELMDDTIDAFMFWHLEHKANSKIPAKVIQYVFETIPDTEKFALPQFINFLVDLQYRASDFTKAKDDLPFDFLFQYCAQWTVLKNQNQVESKLQGHNSIHTLVSNGMGPRVKELKRYVMIPEDQGD